MHTKLVGASRDELEAATKTVVAALLAHSLMRRAAGVSTNFLRREAPILLQHDDGNLIEGVVDLAFREQGPEFTGWTVVDFKTDREFEIGRADYSAQVALYVEAIRRATCSAGRGILLVL